MAHKDDDGVLKAQIRSVTHQIKHSRAEPNHWVLLWVQKWCLHPWVLSTCDFSALVFRILPQRNETENSETKQSKMHIDYVKDAVVETWIMSGNSGEE